MAIGNFAAQPANLAEVEVREGQHSQGDNMNDILEGFI